MKHNKTTSAFALQALASFGAASVALSLLFSAPVTAATAPAQIPLLTSVAGAKPNMMITLDNSGSMGREYQDGYAVSSSTKSKPISTTVCKASLGYYGENNILGGSPKNNKCTVRSFVKTNSGCLSSKNYKKLIQDTSGDYKNFSTPTYYSNSSCSKESTTSTSYVKVTYDNAVYTELGVGVGQETSVAYDNNDSSPWHAQRSSDVNLMYYNPRLTYLPRVNADGSVKATTDGIKSVSNESSSSSRASHKTNNATETFTWAICRTVYYNASGNGTSCRRSDLIEGVISPVLKQGVALPVDNTRTDCVNNACTYDQERVNIVNWYRDYRTRALATATSVGLALSNPAYIGKLRIGYYNINNSDGDANDKKLGINKEPKYLRGVRIANPTNNIELFSWLYGEGSKPGGNTPLHNAISKVAEYYSVPATASEDPWASNPAAVFSADKNERLSCRRSFNLLFSDGAWNDQPSSMSSKDDDNKNGPLITHADGKTTLQYSPSGNADFKLYTPYGSANKGGLADLTAEFAWKDLMPSTDTARSMANDISPTNGKPMFWQNMITYTVGYMISPSGDNANSGLTFDQISAYQDFYRNNGYNASVSAGMIPEWPESTSGNENKIDDFIQAGFTGGGAGYSVANGDEIRRAFESITSDILNSSGRDAGVAASSSSGTNSLSTSALKYGTQYQISDNSGDIKAYKLDEDGKEVNSTAPLWSASKVLSDVISAKGKVTWRKLYTFSTDPGDRGPRTLADGTDVLPTVSSYIAGQLDPLNYFSGTKSLVKYILGDDAQKSSANTPLRQRKSLVGSSVNSAPILAADSLNMGYDPSLAPGVTVAGKATYGKGDLATDFTGGVLTGEPLNFLGNKVAYPPNLYSANNDGLIHVFNAAKITDETTLATILKDGSEFVKAGHEVAAFMPLGVGPKMKNFANENYNFEYVLDGPLSEDDVYNPASSKWQHLLYGTSGRATAGKLANGNDASGRFIYALDVPFKTTLGEKNRVPDGSSFLWERSWPDLGYVSNSPSAGQLSDQAQFGVQAGIGQWVVLSNSGHYTKANKGGLYVLDALTGAEIKFIPTTLDVGRGLGGISVVRDRERRIVAAYAGDANGNLWRFNLGKIFSATKIFTTAGGANQPIYSAPAWQLARGGKYNGTYTLNEAAGASTSAASCSAEKRTGKCGTIVVFGTGMMMDDSDRTNSVQQAIYGVWDPTPINAYQVDAINPIGTALLEQTITSTGTYVDNTTDIDKFYSVSRNAIDYSGLHKGWKLILGGTLGGSSMSGERVIADVANVGSAVAIYSTIIKPTGSTDVETCAKGNASPNMIYVLNGRDGAGTYGFRDGKKGASIPYSVGYLGDGGFSRGIAYQDSGSAGKRETSIETVGKTTEKILDDDSEMKDCTKTTTDALGANGGPAYLIDGCASAQGWLRSWRPILNPPTF